MPTTTPAALADELGVSGTIVRRWLRKHIPREGQGAWVINKDTAERIREHFGPRRTPREPRVTPSCSVDECERNAQSRGMCHMHYQRQRRTGLVEATPRGAHQRAKTACPNGHPYDEWNTLVYSDGRRRCRTCRKGALA